MEDHEKTRKQLLNELAEMRSQIATIKANAAEREPKKRQARRATGQSGVERGRLSPTELALALEQVPAAVLIAHDPQCRHVTGSRFSYELLSVPPGVNLSLTPARGSAPGNFRFVKDGVEIPHDQMPLQFAASQGMALQDYGFDFVFEDGTVKHMLGNAAPLKNEEGDIIGAVAAFSEMPGHGPAEEQLKRTAHELEFLVRERTGELRQANEELEKKTKFMDAVFRQMPSGVVIAEAPSGKLISGNRQVEAILRQDFIAADSIAEYVHYRGFHADGRPYEPDEWPLARSILKGETVNNEVVTMLRGDGSYGTISVSSCPVLDRSGAVMAGVVVFFDISERRRAEELLQREQMLRGILQELEIRIEQRASELREKSEHLDEVNIALKVLLKQREQDRKELGEAMLTNVRNLVLPYVMRLKQSPLSTTQMMWLSTLELHVNEITSPFGRELILQHANLTPTELRVAAMVKDGKTTKEIAEILCISEKSVSAHRDHMRAKLGLRGKRGNLRSYLLSLV